MDRLAASALGALFTLQNLATACVLAAFFALGARAALLLAVDRGRGTLIPALRVLGGAVAVALGGLYLLFTAHVLVWDGTAVASAVAAALLVLAIPFFRLATRRPSPKPGLTKVLVQLCLVLSLLLIASLTLMRAGFLALTQDRPVLLVEVTGETRSEVVRWAAPDQPPREEALATYRVVFRTPEGARVSEAWMYGDQVAVKGRVLRLSPLLSAAGVPNLFELLFAHNGYATAERHNASPHSAVSLTCTGPLAVHGWWRPLQLRLLERWEKGTAEGSSWAVRSATTESTYFPMLDAQGKPVHRTYRVVLTPGGLSSS